MLLFFNVGPFSTHSYWSIAAPWRIEPYTDGWHFAKRIGQLGRHTGIDDVEELTDEETEENSASLENKQR